MRILVCNDDGVDAPGLALLEQVAARISSDVWIVAPDSKRTAASSSLTIGKPLTIRKLGERRYSCSGTPADCVVTAMAWLFRNEKAPDLVLAGINDGRNVAEDRAYSGTLGIAREATFWSIPAIGFSRVKQPETSPADVDVLAGLVGGLWDLRQDWAVEGHFLSINLPVSLPAAVRQPKIGRDKIGRVAELISEEPGAATILFPRGRPHSTTEGDENEWIDAGCICINRLDWIGEAPLTAEFLASIKSKIVAG
jgi:5'-nucleotidase